MDSAGEEGGSQVYNLGNATSKVFRIEQNRYGTGQGEATAQIRGSNTQFDINDVSPAWENYTGQIARTWQWVQVREVK